MNKALIDWLKADPENRRCSVFVESKTLVIQLEKDVPDLGNGPRKYAGRVNVLLENVGDAKFDLIGSEIERLLDDVESGSNRTGI